MSKTKQTSDKTQTGNSSLGVVSEWRMFEATVTLKDGSKTTYIGSTIGNYEDAKKEAINNDWKIQAVDAVVAFR